MSTRSASDGPAVVQAVIVIMGVVVSLTFLFGFGNVLNLALRLGVPVWIALWSPLVWWRWRCSRSALCSWCRAARR
jgi:uncharacterized protein (DUF983 family)